jgi:hypothetical protein
MMDSAKVAVSFSVARVLENQSVSQHLV